jgi:hypothetical protein
MDEGGMEVGDINFRMCMIARCHPIWGIIGSLLLERLYEIILENKISVLVKNHVKKLKDELDLGVWTTLLHL